MLKTNFLLCCYRRSQLGEARPIDLQPKYDLNDFKNSTKSFSKVIILNPNSELASLGLFQSLVHLGKARKALKELFRFTENNEPKLYLVTIKELVEEDNIKNIKFKIDKKKIENLFKKWCSLP